MIQSIGALFFRRSSKRRGVPLNCPAHDQNGSADTKVQSHQSISSTRFFYFHASQGSWKVTVELRSAQFEKKSLVSPSRSHSTEVKGLLSATPSTSSTHSSKIMTRLGFDPRTLSVLRIRDNQLHHPASVRFYLENPLFAPVRI